MERRSSITSLSSAVTAKVSASAGAKLSPLIDLERLVYRFSPLLKEDSTDSKKLQGYLEEAERLLTLVEANESTFAEFEALDRLEWVKAKIDLLKQIITKEKIDSSKVTAEKDESTIAMECRTPNNTIQTSANNSIGSLDVPKTANNVTDTITITNTSTSASTILLKSPLLDVNEILPEKPKSDFLNIPSTLPKAATKPGDSLQFSDSTQAEHDSLTEELIQTVRLIRRNNLHLRDMVKADDQVIEEATTLLTGNTDKLQREGRNLKEYSRSVWMTTWRMLSLMALAVMLFLFAYLFIRLT